MGRKSNHLMERVYAHLSKNGCRKSGFLADPDLTGTVLNGKYRIQIENYTIQMENYTIQMEMYRLQMESIECKLKIIQYKWKIIEFKWKIIKYKWKRSLQRLTCHTVTISSLGYQRYAN
jgi:hypothetical protein